MGMEHPFRRSTRLSIEPHRSRPLSARRALIVAVAVILVAAGLAPAAGAAPSGWDNVDETGTDVRPMTFPIQGDTYYVDTWLYPRGSRRHLGVDMMAEKLTPIVAVRSGCITYLDYGGPGGGNMLTLTDDEGWEYRYIHMNNDTPGTDDGANPYEWAFANGLQEGDCVTEGQLISFVGDSGNAEYSGSHLHFEVRRPDGIWINPTPSVDAARANPRTVPDTAGPDTSGPDTTRPAENPATDDPALCRARTAPEGTPSASSARGYWLLDSSGRVHAYDAPELGDLTTIGVDTAPASFTATASGEGYWIVDVDGVVHPFGDAVARGDMSGTELNGAIRRLVPTPDDNGYWLVGADGGVFAFGAPFLGSMGYRKLNAPVISITSTTDGDGYWLVGADGGVFTFGTARFRGSTGDMKLDAPIIDLAVDPAGEGYWLYAEDGGVFAYGVPFYGSAPGLGRCDLAESVAMRVTDTGQGYWVVTSEGEVLEFGDAADHGDRPELAEGVTVVDMAVRHGSPSADDPGVAEETSGTGE